MQLPQWLARFNKYVTNPIQRTWAPYVPTMGLLEHVGRRSGKPYRTPLTVFTTDDGVAILLTYGPDRDWLKNVMAADGAQMRRYGHAFELTEPRVTSKVEAATHVQGFWKPIFTRLPFDQAVLLRRVG